VSVLEVDLRAAGDALPRPFEHCYWLLPGRLLAGAHPAAQGTQVLQARLAALRGAGVTRFIDLTAARDALPSYAPPWAQRSNFPIEDFGVPAPATLRATLDAIASALDQGERLYLHCRAGIGRTGTVAACWLVEQGLGAGDALALLRRKFQASAQSFGGQMTPENDDQRAFVMAWRAAGAPA
jgi:atypical dual specificity phosphatase